MPNLINQMLAKYNVIISFHNESQYFEDVLIQAVSIFDKNSIVISVDAATDEFWGAISEKAIKIGITDVRRYEFADFAKVLNSLITVCTNEYIVRVDADDLILPARYKMLEKMIDGGYDFGFSDAILMEIEGNKVTYKRRIFRFFPALLIVKLGYNPIIHPSVIFRRQLFLDRPYKSAHRREDLATFIDLPLKTKTLNFREPTLIYRTPSAKGINIQNGEHKYGFKIVELLFKILFRPKVISK